MKKVSMGNSLQGLILRRVRYIFFLLFTCAGAIALLLPSQVALAAQGCANGQQIPVGKYYLFNNLWGANTGTGEQCIWDTANNGSSIGWSTSWNWSGQFQVKSFDSVVLGWHFQKPTTPYLTGLPMQLSSDQPVQTNWTYHLSQNGPNSTFNIAYDLWLHTIADPAMDNPSDEVMLWLYKQGNIQPVGSPGVSVTIDGTGWTLWTGLRSGWQVHTFVRNTNATGAQSFNLSDFLNYLVSHQGLSPAKYLTGIEAGSEVWLGNAELDTSSYSTDVGSAVGVSPLPTPSPTPMPSPTPSPTLTPTSTSTSTPLPTPTSAPIHGASPTPVITSRSDSDSSGNNWLAISFFIALPIAAGGCVFLIMRSRLIKTESGPRIRVRR
jgi:hypothetical protein